jgi:hypothetical protein
MNTTLVIHIGDPEENRKRCACCGISVRYTKTSCDGEVARTMNNQLSAERLSTEELGHGEFLVHLKQTM